MFISRSVPKPVLRILAGALLLSLAAVLRAAIMRGASGVNEAGQWSRSEVITPAELAEELSNTKAEEPAIVCVGFDRLYRANHIVGASYHGPASKPEGLEDLKKWAKTVPRSQRIVLYCGCCPWGQCPNIRPAFHALKQMGFARLQVLSIPQDLGRDWVAKGFPIDQAK